MKVVTAIGNPIINEKLKEYEYYEVIGKDIQYEEGIFEILEEVKRIDILILSNNIPGDYDFKKLINKILKTNENLKLIIFLKEKDQVLENYLNSINIFEIYSLDNIEEFFYKINNKIYANKNNDSKEIKELIKNSLENIDDFNKKSNRKKQKKSNIIFKKDEEKDTELLDSGKKEIIVITGNDGSGKSIFSAIFSNFLIKQNKKVLLIDLDFNYSTINYLFDIKNKDSKNLIVNIKNNFDLICNLKKMLFQPNFNTEFTYKELQKYKIIYDYIIVDLPGNIKREMVKEILKIANKIIYLFEPNLIEMQKANLFLESYINDLEINCNKIKLVLNKTNKYKIAKSILESVFSEYDIIGEVEYNEILNYVINKTVFNELSINIFEKTFINISI